MLAWEIILRQVPKHIDVLYIPTSALLVIATLLSRAAGIGVIGLAAPVVHNHIWLGVVYDLAPGARHGSGVGYPGCG